MTTAPRHLDLCLELNRAYARLVRKLDGRLGSLHGISFGDYALLRQLADGRLRRVDLADRLGLTPSAVTRALIPLEKIGLVQREADERDARVGHASLTKAGERVVREATETAELAAEEMLDVGSKEIGSLLGALAKI